IEDRGPWILGDRRRDRGALLLSAREGHAALADHRVVARGEIFDVLVELRDVPGPFELGIGELFIQTEAHVLAQRHREEECFLWDVADRATELRERGALHADAVDEKLALLAAGE